MKSRVLNYIFCAALLMIPGVDADDTVSLVDAPMELGEAGDAFTFVRIQYDTAGGLWDDDEYQGPRHTWSVDYPASDQNFLRGVRRLTHIHVCKDPIVLRLDDERIFEYPFLYMLEVGRQGGIQLSDNEIRNLRKYLLRGGFLFIDDFWGTRQWSFFHRTFSNVFPGRPIVELEKEHQIFQSYFDIDGPQMIPRVHNIDNYPEQDVDVAINRAILDDHHRVMVLINWNSDIGDGWEHTHHPTYPTRYANMAYRLGINYLMYALTH